MGLLFFWRARAHVAYNFALVHSTGVFLMACRIWPRPKGVPALPPQIVLSPVTVQRRLGMQTTAEDGVHRSARDGACVKAARRHYAAVAQCRAAAKDRVTAVSDLRRAKMARKQADAADVRARISFAAASMRHDTILKTYTWEMARQLRIPAPPPARDKGRGPKFQLRACPTATVGAARYDRAVCTAAACAAAVHCHWAALRVRWATAAFRAAFRRCAALAAAANDLY
jgi:hypothetical protein